MPEKKVTILDGGMGRELARRSAPFRQPEWSALALMEAPEIVKQVHQDFIENGAQVITTNSYSLVPFHIGEQTFAERGLELTQLAATVAKQARKSVGNQNVQIAGSIPPLFGSYRADLYQANRVTEIITPLIAGLDDSCDFWLLETQSLIAEATAVIGQIRQLSEHNKPIWVSFTLEDAEPTDQPLLRSGEPVSDAVNAMSQLGVSAILFNCCQPEIIEQALIAARQLLSAAEDSIQLGAYANAFPPQPKDATANDGLDELRDDLSPDAYLLWAQKWREQGATLIGGCCGIGPEHIGKLAEFLR